MENPIIYDRIDELKSYIDPISAQIAALNNSVNIIQSAVDIGNLRDKNMVFLANNNQGSNIELCNVTGRGRLLFAFAVTNHSYASQMDLIIDGKSTKFWKTTPVGSSKYFAGYMALRTFIRVDNGYYNFRGNTSIRNSFPDRVRLYDEDTFYVPGEAFMDGTFNSGNKMIMLATDVEIPFESLIVRRSANSVSTDANPTYVAYYLED